MTSIFNAIIRFWWNLCYGITRGAAWILGLLYDLFEKAVGLDTVTYQGKDLTLLQIIFSNTTITRVYWVMAIIGIGLCFFFTILAVIRKTFDSYDEVKASLGQILTRCFTCIIIICSMSVIMSMAMYFTSSLMEGVQIAFFSNTEEASTSDPKTYTRTEYAAMARVMNTIGNYSLNPSYNSSYNINSCYNAIRSDLALLEDAGTFSVSYETPDVLHKQNHYWQEALQKIVLAAPSLTEDIALDKSNSTLSTAIVDVMNELKNDKQFLPLENYASSVVTTNSNNIELDRIVLLVGTLDASYDSKYNGANASIKDLLRAPFYYNNANHNLYSVNNMWDSFDLSEYHYIYVLFMTIVMILNMAGILMTAIARIFNMAMLYIVSPPIIATAPLDDGAKFKQWRVAFMIQCFSVFGTMVSIDLIVTFIPIIMSNDLVIFDSTIANYLAKLVIIWGGMAASQKAAALVGSILGESAGMSAFDALRMDEAAGGLSSAAAYMTGGKILSTIGDNIIERGKDKLPFSAARAAAKGSRDSGGSQGSSDGGGTAGGGDSAGGGNASAGGGTTGNTTSTDPKKVQTPSTNNTQTQGKQQNGTTQNGTTANSQTTNGTDTNTDPTKVASAGTEPTTDGDTNTMEDSLRANSTTVPTKFAIPGQPDEDISDYR